MRLKDLNIVSNPTLAGGGEGELARPPIPDLRRIALFADLDGTLAPIEQTPDAVGPSADLGRLLAALEKALDGRLAVVSGRSLADLDRVLAGHVRALAAIHGLVRRRADGVILAQADDGAITAASRVLTDFSRADPRLIVEDKGLAVALHFRRAPDQAGACAALAHRLARRLRLGVQEGDMVIELRLTGPDKGAAVTAFMNEPPFAGFSPVFLGDDLTDESGFAAARDLGGLGVVVGARRPTQATYALDNVADAAAWLSQALGAS